MSAGIFLDVTPAVCQTVCDRASQRLDFLAGRSKTHTQAGMCEQREGEKEKKMMLITKMIIWSFLIIVFHVLSIIKIIIKSATECKGKWVIDM